MGAGVNCCILRFTRYIRLANIMATKFTMVRIIKARCSCGNWSASVWVTVASVFRAVWEFTVLFWGLPFCFDAPLDPGFCSSTFTARAFWLTLSLAMTLSILSIAQSKNQNVSASLNLLSPSIVFQSCFRLLGQGATCALINKILKKEISTPVNRNRYRFLDGINIER